MMSRVWEKVEYVRSQPEHVRMRYVLGCLVVSMVFIVGIWMLSLRESFATTSDDLSFPEEKALLESTGGVPSLQDLLRESAPLQVENEGAAPMSGEEFFMNQFNQGQQTPPADQSGNSLEGEGISGSAPQP